MRGSDKKSQTAAINCLEVLVPKIYLDNNVDNIYWTLSVYSLENAPLKQERSSEQSDTFRFMVYDWRRTIRKLLEHHQIPFSVVQYFTSDGISNDERRDFSRAESDLIDTLNRPLDRNNSDASPRRKSSRISSQKEADLLSL